MAVGVCGKLKVSALYVFVLCLYSLGGGSGYGVEGLSVVPSMSVCQRSFLHRISSRWRFTERSNSFRNNAVERWTRDMATSDSCLYNKNGKAQVRRRGYLLQLAALSVATILFGRPLSASAQDVVGEAAASLPVVVGLREFLAASTLVVSVAGISMSRMGLHGLSRQILVACTRSTLQLFLLTALVLRTLLSSHSPWVVFSWITGAGFIAALEAWVRVEYSYPKLRQHLVISVLGGGISVMGMALGLRVFGDLTPWFRPRTWIPVGGMLFGNTLSSTALAAGSLTKGFSENRAAVETRLAKGATAKEAVLPVVRGSLMSALLPMINMLSISGVVHLPGMMTGQILSGQSTQQAAAYQVLILFLIAAMASVTVQILARLVTRELVDYSKHRLKPTLPTNTRVLTKVGSLQESTNKTKKSIRIRLLLIMAVRLVASVVGVKIFKDETMRHLETSKVRMVETEMNNKENELPDGAKPASTLETPPRFLTPKVKSAFSTVSPEGASSASAPTELSEGKGPILRVDRVHIERPNFYLSFDLEKGHRLGITGSSGIGKTQVLRTLAALEPSSSGSLSLRGTRLDDDTLKAPEWRTRLSWISQDRPTLEGTPLSFYEEICHYSQQQKSLRGKSDQVQSPIDIGREFGLDAALFSRPWSTLSGGEAQRASLAIVLALNPDVLLLDESTSALDEDTTKLVECKLIETGIPIVMVTHSNAQLDRFCTHHLDLSASGDPVDTQPTV